ncbi:phage/plasmid replication protein, II/X family [Aeromonas caviae]|uniref:phage/plasmid replication protein, II/X family n=1 Tax=Aeromonas caviae TaxID=648 RepID=UPI0038CF5AAB
MSVFCDYFKFAIPLRHSARYSVGGQTSYDDEPGLCDRLWQVDLQKFSALTDISLRAMSVSFADSGIPIFTGLTHRWDSLPSSFASIAFRICQACPQSGLPARLEIQCSPATLAHIQNVVSNITTIEDASWIVLSSAAMALPLVFEHLDLDAIQVLRFDVTDSIVCANPAQAKQLLERMRRVSRGQRRPLDGESTDSDVAQLSGYETSCYWGATSELHRAIAYLKGPELRKKIVKAHRFALKNPTSLVASQRLHVLSRPALLELADCMVRLEGRWLKRGVCDHLTRLGLTDAETPWDGRLSTLIDIERRYTAQSTDKAQKNLLSACWDYSWHPVLTALQGDENLDICDLTAIEKAIFETRTPRQARPLLQFFRLLCQLGFDELSESSDYSRSTFYRRVTELVKLGLSRAQLQQLDGSAERRIEAGVVIPIRQVLQVGRMTQYPAWFEPVDVETWQPFDPSVRRAVGAMVGPLPLPVSLVAREEGPSCDALPDVTSPRFEKRQKIMDPESRFTPSRVAVEPVQIGLDFMGPDHTKVRPVDPLSDFSLAIGRVRAAQVGEADALGIRRTLIDGSEFNPRIPRAQLQLVQ